MKQKTPLPIDPYLPGIEALWAGHQTIIVKASPGSGKTTRLPWLLAQRSQKRVVVLEPRRLAAKLAAQRIADEEGLSLGRDVGYHFRFEKNHQNDSKLVFYTEGTFLRLLLRDDEAVKIGTVILDEFHERHLETDLALGALRRLQEKNPELKLVLMSATLDAALVDFFPGAGLVEIEARQYQVKIHYLPNQPSVLNEALPTKVRRTISALPADSGDVLVFLPGMREMRAASEHLRADFGDVFLLHADLEKEEQNRALGPNPRRKIILSTNIAESSLTIPGIRVVIDSGIQREARYSPWTGMKTLEDRPITQSSAIQRAGRAGRTSDGLCYRLYAEQDYNNREPYTVPEILKADLTDTYLLASQFSLGMKWFTPPPPERWQKARELLERLGALDPDGRLNGLGEKLLRYPLGARLARVLLAAQNFSAPEKKRLLRFISEVIERDPSGSLARRLTDFLRDSGSDISPMEKALLAGFVDQVARFRHKQHDFIHYSGKTLKIHPSLRDLHHDFYLVLDITPRLEAFTVVPIQEEWLFGLEPFPFTEEDELEVGDHFRLRRRTNLGSIPMEEMPLPLDWASLSSALKEKLLVLGATPFQKRWKEFQETDSFLRLHYLGRQQNVELEEHVSLAGYLEAWQSLSWQHLETYFAEELGRALSVSSLELELPSTINLGGKRDLKVHYPYGLDPFVEAPIQDFYGVTQTPTIMRGKVPLTMKLLGPHKRPIQVTRDIMGFWKKTYQEMKKEWQREYPRHHWPDQPETAKPILLKRQLGN